MAIFSFVICTRNSQRVLRDVINSVLNQTDRASILQIILVDYKSTDLTIDIAMEMLQESNIELIILKCHLPGKSAAIIEGFNKANGKYIVVLDDDNVLSLNYISNAKRLIENPNVGCVGAMGIVDSNLILPDWFSVYKGVYAIGMPVASMSVDSVWGAAALIKKEAWDKLYRNGFKFELNPARESHSSPISIGGEDGEISIAIKMIGYKVFYSDTLQFTHKFEQKRLSKEYLLQNTFGSTRAVPIIDIYGLFIHHNKSRVPYFIWTTISTKRIIGSYVRALIYAVLGKSLEFKYQLVRGEALICGYSDAKYSFKTIYKRLEKILESQSV